jgi:hypothetical protein
MNMPDLATAHGPFVSAHLPPGTDLSTWRVLRHSLSLDGIDDDARAALSTLDLALSSGDGRSGRMLVAARDELLLDEPPAWSPPAALVRVSDLPYLLPLAPRHAVPNQLVVDGLTRSTAMLSAGVADALVVRVDVLGDRTVWVGGTQRDQVAADAATPRAAGLPPNRQRADEALPMAALTIGADVWVAGDDVPLTDGVGVLARHPLPRPRAALERVPAGHRLPGPGAGQRRSTRR